MYDTTTKIFQGKTANSKCGEVLFLVVEASKLTDDKNLGIFFDAEIKGQFFFWIFYPVHR